MEAIIDTTKIKIETERCILRAFNKNDLEDLFEYAKVPGVGEMAGWDHHKNIEESKTILDMFIKDKNNLAVVYKENNKVIGSFGFNSFNDNYYLASSLKGKEIGYVISKDYWGKGIATECLKSIINYSFNTLNYDFLFCGFFLDNLKSKRVQEKCGFKYYKIYDHKTISGKLIKTQLNILLNKK